MAAGNPPAAITMREGVTSSETIGYGWALLKYTAQGSQQTRRQWRPDSGRTTPTDTTHNGDAHWAVSMGLSAVLWISIPAAASIVAPQRRKKEERKDHQVFFLGGPNMRSTNPRCRSKNRSKNCDISATI